MGRLMNQTYFEWYEFDDANVVRIITAICVLINQYCSEYE